MGRLTEVLSAVENLIKATVGSFDINEMEHLQPLGDDSKPLPKDNGWSDRTSESGRYIHFGAFDFDNKIAAPGEKRIYGRNADGESVNSVHLFGNGDIKTENSASTVRQLEDGTVISTNGSCTHEQKPDGSIESVNSAGFIKLLADGSVNINGFIITPAGSATSPVSVGAPIITSATMTANAAGVSMGGAVVMNGENYNVHGHTPGTYQDAEARLITGNSGGKV